MKLWSFYCDLEESLGSLNSSREMYDPLTFDPIVLTGGLLRAGADTSVQVHEAVVVLLRLGGEPRVPQLQPGKIN
jgi:hypothetical protein